MHKHFAIIYIMYHLCYNYILMFIIEMCKTAMILILKIYQLVL